MRTLVAAGAIAWLGCQEPITATTGVDGGVTAVEVRPTRDPWEYVGHPLGVRFGATTEATNKATPSAPAYPVAPPPVIVGSPAVIEPIAARSSERVVTAAHGSALMALA